LGENKLPVITCMICGRIINKNYSFVDL